MTGLEAKSQDVSDGQVKTHSKKLQLQYDEDENKERGNWTGRFDFMLSVIGYAVGLGNVWRFPYLCYRNGGGVFLIPYVILMAFVGLPLLYMELSLGQFCSNGPLTCWEFARLFKGIGVAQIVISTLAAIYYNVIVAWAVYYMIASFSALPNLPWESCSNSWNTAETLTKIMIVCASRLPDVNCTKKGFFRQINGTCWNETSVVGIWDYSLFTNVTGLRRELPSSQFYKVLGLSSGLDDMGTIRWELALCLLGAWLVVFLCMIKGIKSVGKVVYVTALLPYVILIILFGRGISLPNASAGIYFYVKPQWERLLEARVWYDAAVQMFFSLGSCWGGLLALASYNRFRNNCLIDAVAVAIGDAATSIFAGFVVFSFMGFLANEMNMDVEKLVDDGPGLAFVIYPEAVSRMPGSAFWAILFFTMLFAIGLDTQFTGLETLLASLFDQFTSLRHRKKFTLLVICSTLFLLGLPLCMNGGAYMLLLMDNYCSGWAILFVALVECISIAWVYGVKRFLLDIQLMLGARCSIWWRISWQFFCPLMIVFTLLFAWISNPPLTYADYYYPRWSQALGEMISLCSVIWIFIVAIIEVCREYGPLGQRLRELTRPTIYWGPALVQFRKLVDYVPGFVVDPWEEEQEQGNSTTDLLDDRNSNTRLSKRGLITNGKSLSAANNSVLSVNLNKILSTNGMIAGRNVSTNGMTSGGNISNASFSWDDDLSKSSRRNHNLNNYSFESAV